MRTSTKQESYSGQVIDINDPLKQGRCKVRIPEIHGDMDDELIPWARTYFESRGGVGLDIPAKDDVVSIMFDNEDPLSPVYTNKEQSKDTNKDFSEVLEDYPNTNGAMDGHGNKYWFNKKSGVLNYLMKNGDSVKIEDDGSIIVNGVSKLNITIKGDTTLTLEGDLTADVSGKCDITVSGDTTIKSPNIFLDGDVTITKTLQVDDSIHSNNDTVAGSISLQNHNHPVPGVKSGPSTKTAVKPY